VAHHGRAKSLHLGGPYGRSWPVNPHYAPRQIPRDLDVNADPA